MLQNSQNAMASLPCEAEFIRTYSDPSKQDIDEDAKDNLNIPKIDDWADISTSSNDSGAFGISVVAGVAILMAVVVQ